MRFGLVLSLVALSLFTPVVAGAQETVSEVQYISVLHGFDKKRKGSLVIDESTISLQEKSKGRILLTIATAIVRQVDFRNGVNGGSAGRETLLGVFASHDEEFVTLITEDGARAEGIVFKMKQNTSAGIVAKCQYRIRARMARDSMPPRSS
jgi:hypothetical protein